MRSGSDKTAKWLKLANSFSVCVLLVFTFFPSSGHAQGAGEIQDYTLEYPCEIAIILDDSKSVPNYDFSQMIDVVHQIPKHFEMGDNYSRVAVISFAVQSKIHLNLTANERVLQALNVTRQRGYTRTDLALKDVKEKVFVDTRPEALKIVILITDGRPEDLDGPRFNLTEDAADELKKDGSLVYVAFVGSMTQEDEDHVKRVAGDPSQVFPIQDFDTLKRVLMPGIQQQIMCRFEQVCRFDDPKQQNCVGAWWRQRDLLSGLNCTNVPPTSITRQCRKADCDVICEKWPWQKWACDHNNAGQRLTINHEGKMPLQHQSVFDNCPRQKEIMCPMVSSNTTVSSMTTVSGGPNIDDASESDPGASTPFPPWAIALVAIVVVLLLLLILMAAFLTVRKRKKEREAAALAKEKAEMAAMAKKKGASSLSPSLPSYGLEHGGKVPAADHSMEVSLAAPVSKRISMVKSAAPVSKQIPMVKSAAPVSKRISMVKSARIKKGM